MSGGYIRLQKKGGHQVVIFTFIGEFGKDEVEAWNQEILTLKRRFGNRLAGVTIKGDPTPAGLLAPKKK
jgi:hypothetical protein